MTKQCFNNGQLEPKNNPVSAILVKDSKKCAEQQNNCNCSCEEVK